VTTQNNSQELASKLRTHIEELARAADAARLSAEMQAYLDLSARFHRYSPYNVWLISWACPNATRVAGFRKWRSLGRTVGKGQTGIPILAPIFAGKAKNLEEDEASLVGFKVVYVFDISQTEGNPLPEQPNWKSLERDEELSRRLMAFAQSRGITVQESELVGEMQGLSSGLVILLAPQAGTKTLIHEIAHELMHQKAGSQRDRTVRELEAESVAYVVARHFGLENLASPNYVALLGADAGMILAHLERIRSTAVEIIASVELREKEFAAIG